MGSLFFIIAEQRKARILRAVVRSPGNAKQVFDSQQSAAKRASIVSSSLARMISKTSEVPTSGPPKSTKPLRAESGQF